MTQRSAWSEEEPGRRPRIDSKDSPQAATALGLTLNPASPLPVFNSNPGVRKDDLFYLAKIKRNEKISSSSGLKTQAVDLVYIYKHFMARAGNLKDRT